ncbi:MAG TPA: chromate efflux transporter, partial [Thermaerobacter sp.]
MAAVFLRLGCLAFGGPAAHIAMMREELVVRRRWLDERRFLDLLSVTHLIPGPNSTELAIHLGYERAGWRGLVVAGACFILPAALMVLALAHVYTRYGATPQAGWFLYGIKPVILGIVAHALVGLGRAVLGGRAGMAVRAALAAAVLVLYLVGVHELLLLFGAGIFYTIARRAGRARAAAGGWLAVPAAWSPPAGAPAEPTPGAGPAPARLVPPGTGALLTGTTLATGGGAAAVPFSLSTLFLTFCKIGAVLYGSGYVLLAFLRNDFVLRLGWLTDRQLLDAVAVGQVTPGPVFTTATFVGYLTGGWAGAAAATVGIFLPSFLFVAAIRPLADRLR